MWMICAVLSSVFAAATSILAKIGIEGVNSNLATAVRTVVVLIMAWAMVFITNTQGGLRDSTVHVGRDEFLTVKAHVVAEHVLSLKSHERGADDQRDGDQELQAHKQVPEHTPLGA